MYKAMATDQLIDFAWWTEDRIRYRRACNMANDTQQGADHAAQDAAMDELGRRLHPSDYIQRLPITINCSIVLI